MEQKNSKDESKKTKYTDSELTFLKEAKTIAEQFQDVYNETKIEHRFVKEKRCSDNNKK